MDDNELLKELMTNPTEREKELVRIIEENPTISQTEIADQMGITRSSVSVNITNLMKKGVIKGRGYVLAKQGYPVLIGAANYDCIAISNGSVAITDSQIPSGHVRFNITYAGFAKIVSEILARFELSPLPIFAIGNDLFGAQIVKELQSNSISTEEVLTTDSAPTSMYFELFDSKVDRTLMYLSNAEVSKCITPQYLKSKHHILRNASFFALEDALPVESASSLFSSYPNTPRYFLANADPSFLAYRDSFKYFDMVTISHEMIQNLAGMPIDNNLDDDNIVKLARAFLQDGPKSVLIPYAGNKLCFATQESCYLLCNETQNLSEVTYASCRMAVFSAFICYDHKGTPLLETLNYVAAAQMLSAKSIDANRYQHSNISPININNVLKNSCFSIKRINY